MRRIQLAAIAALGIACVAGATAHAQSAALLTPGEGSGDKVYGYVDLKTGTFHQVAADKPAPETITGTTTIGVIDLTIDITLSTALPKGATILCNSNVGATSTATSPAFDEQYTEVAATYATISGSKASCVVKLPYSWILAPKTSTGANSTYSGQYKVTASFVSSATEPITDFNVIRQTTGIFLNTTVVPATGTTSSFTVSATL